MLVLRFKPTFLLLTIAGASRLTTSKLELFMPTYMGIDYGTKRIGLAVGDDQMRVATPLKMLPTCPKTIDTIAAIISVAHEYMADEFVVGLPLNMDDSEGPQAKLTRQFGDQLSSVAMAAVHYWDERLTSRDARMKLVETGLTRAKKKARVDGIAAQILLQGFLEAKGGEDSVSNPVDYDDLEDDQ